MQPKRVLIPLFGLLTVCASCAREPPEQAPPTAQTSEQPGTTAPSDVSPVSAQAWIDDVTIGTALAPAGSAVKVVWFGPNEKYVGEETKAPVPGQHFLNFTAQDTRSWDAGGYRAEVWVGDERVNQQQFQIVSAPSAGR